MKIDVIGMPDEFVIMKFSFNTEKASCLFLSKAHAVSLLDIIREGMSHYGASMYQLEINGLSILNR